MRYFLDLAYKGTNYHGWQKQNNAVSVQEVVEEKLSMILREPLEIVASGRTDTGVHAKQQYIHFDTETELNENLLFRINCVLPYDISVKSFHRVAPDAHARFDASYREYEYIITTVKDPFSRTLSWYFPRPLDIDKMNQGAEYLLKNSDFKSFSKVKTDVSTFICKIEKAYWQFQGNNLVFTIRANRFLRGMVRAIVGSLIDVGLGKTKPEMVERIIELKCRNEAGAAAPPEGLYLTKVGYPEDFFCYEPEVL